MLCPKMRRGLSMLKHSLVCKTLQTRGIWPADTANEDSNQRKPIMQLPSAWSSAPSEPTPLGWDLGSTWIPGPADEELSSIFRQLWRNSRNAQNCDFDAATVKTGWCSWVSWVLQHQEGIDKIEWFLLFVVDWAIGWRFCMSCKWKKPAFLLSTWHHWACLGHA